MKKILTLFLILIGLGFLFAQDVITSETSEVTVQATNSTHVAGDGSDHSAVAVNTTHAGSDGKNHSDVVTNTTHAGSDGKNHSDVVTNTTHAGSDGKNHSDVVINTTHITADGSAHANVATNTTHITADGSAHANVATNTTHISSDGKNHADVVINTTHAGSDGKNHSDVVDNTTHSGSDGKDHSDVVTNTSGIGTLNTQSGIEAVLVDADLNIGTGAFISKANAGSADSSSVVVVEYGNGFHHRTVLTLTDHIIGTPTAGITGDFGSSIYEFPSGTHIHYTTYYNIALTAQGNQADTPEIAIGSVKADGSSATLSSTEMDYITANAWSTTLDGAVPEVDGPVGATAGILTGISLNTPTDSKDVFLNAADDWNASITDELTATGTVILIWDFIE